MSSFLSVVSPGLVTTIQDLGRFGHQAQGVPVSGALDFVNLRLANALVGNPEGQGALEMRILGPTLKVGAASVRVALTGTDAFIEVVSPQPERVPAYQSVTLKQDQVFRIGTVSDSAVCYLAVAGGFDVPLLYGSQSTYATGGLGGFKGRGLQAGDQVPLAQVSVDASADLYCPSPVRFEKDAPVRVVLGPQADYFSESGVRTFLSQTFTVTPDASRMGARLQGPEIEHSKGADINSDGIVTGSIQVPGNGLPIVLLADHQTTGGYPKIASVISADIPGLGQRAPRAKVRFEAVSVSDAELARRELEQKTHAAIASITQVATELSLDDLLMGVNLVSGVYVE